MAHDIFNRKLKGDLLLHKRQFLLYPPYWKDKKNQIHLNLSWRFVPFSRTNITSIPDDAKGIYCFVVEPKIANFFETKYLFYIGKTTRTFRQRYSEYLDDQEGKGKPRPKVLELLDVYAKHLFFYFAPIANDADIALVEDKLIDAFVPWVNTQIPEAKIKPELRYIYGS